jgi:hypothetical protein
MTQTNERENVLESTSVSRFSLLSVRGEKTFLSTYSTIAARAVFFFLIARAIAERNAILCS